MAKKKAGIVRDVGYCLISDEDPTKTYEGIWQRADGSAFTALECPELANLYTLKQCHDFVLPILGQDIKVGKKIMSGWVRVR